MRRVRRGSGIAWAAMWALCVAACVAVDREPPNIVVILADDLGYGDIGAFGNMVHRTPHLDRMAAEGMRLTDFYAAPCCTPARAQLMTGCYAKRVGMNDGPREWVLLPAEGVGLNPDEATVAEVLKAEGYATGCIGKWHLGDQPPFVPTRQGFDEFFGLPYSNDMWPPFIESDEPKAVELRKKFNHAPLPLMRGEKVLHAVEDQSVLTETYVREAEGFIRRNKKRRFFLYLPHTAVHIPLHPGRAFEGKSANGKYGDWVEELDAGVGRVLDAVRAAGIERRTLVVFTSDNGGIPHRGASNRPLRGGKASCWEGGTRVPFIAWWPGRVPAGAACGEMAGLIDLLPTFARLAGAAVPQDRIIDGRDIGPLLVGERGARPPHEAMCYFSRKRLEAVRSGPWKLWFEGPRLYNLDADIGESADVAAKHPEVVARLLGLAEGARRDLGDGSPEFPGAGLRPPGRVEKPRLLIAHDGTIASDVKSDGR